jgi:hypothetical protein
MERSSPHRCEAMQITQNAIPPAKTLARIPRQTTITIRLLLITGLSAGSGCR